MKLRTIFEYRDYKKFIENYVQSLPSGGHGEKSKIAAAIRCHNAYLSQVLMGKADLSLEQGFALARYLHLASDETDQLLLLIQLSRAGTEELRRHTLKKIEAVEQSRSVLQNRIQYKKKLGKEETATYFSAWYYSVIHLMISTLPQFKTAAQLEESLQLPPATIHQTLQFLETSGLIRRDGAEFHAGGVDIHLDSDSTMILPHHTHWRLQAVKALEDRKPHDLHYSSAVTVSEADFKMIHEELIQAVSRVRETISKTKPEKVAVMTLDWFGLSR